MSAVILSMPAKLQRTAERRMVELDLQAQHAWIMKNRDRWDNVEIDGRIYRDRMDCGPAQEILRSAVRQHLGVQAPTMATMRKDVVEGRKRIDKRNRIKQWVRSHGATDADLATQEAALAFMFDQMHGRGTAPEAAEHRQRNDQRDREEIMFRAQRATMLNAFIRNELGASPAMPKLSVVKAIRKPSDQAED